MEGRGGRGRGEEGRGRWGRERENMWKGKEEDEEERGFEEAQRDN